VIEVAFQQGLATIARPDDLLAYVKQSMFDPKY